MKIPKTIEEGVHTYTIELQQDDMLLDCYGMVKHDQLRMILDSSMPESRIAGSFLHEVLEVLDSNYEIGLKHWQITAIEHALLTCIRRNDLDFRKGKNEKD